MKRKTKTIALCGVLAALAVALLFLGGALPFAAIACPVLASLVLIPVYAETGWKWGLAWYLTVALLGLLLAPDKEAAILFVFFGYYPILRKWFGRLRSRILRWALKLIYVNLALLAAYALMIFVFQLEAIAQEYAQIQTYLLIGLLLLANLSFVIYDLLIGRLEIYYHVRLRPKLNL
ncbi:MAG: hypothetical protein IJJ99_08910 [Oscillospiraceae bacterium]|nr:hypothetical protein [Oscillospiraceae bacterium]